MALGRRRPVDFDAVCGQFQEFFVFAPKIMLAQMFRQAGFCGFANFGFWRLKVRAGPFGQIPSFFIGMLFFRIVGHLDDIVALEFVNEAEAF
jgi:hypothetical protein